MPLSPQYSYHREYSRLWENEGLGRLRISITGNLRAHKWDANLATNQDYAPSRRINQENINGGRHHLSDEPRWKGAR